MTFLYKTIGREKLIFKVKSDLTQIQNMKQGLSISSFCFSTPLFTLLALGHDSQKVALTLCRSSFANLIISLTKWVFFAVEHLTKVYCILWYVFIHWLEKEWVMNVLIFFTFWLCSHKFRIWIRACLIRHFVFQHHCSPF